MVIQLCSQLHLFSNIFSPESQSHPLVHDIVSPLNQFHVISLNSQHFQSLIPTLIDLMFYSRSVVQFEF